MEPVAELGVSFWKCTEGGGGGGGLGSTVGGWKGGGGSTRMIET